MTAQLMPYFIQKFFDANGNALSGGKLFTYQAGTSTPLATYTDETAGTPNANPIVLDSSGQASVWLGSSAYKLILQDSLGNVIKTVDNVSYINLGSIDKTMVNSNIAGQALLQNVSTKALDVQVDNVFVQVNGSNQLTLKPGAITADFLPASSKLEVLFKNTRDLTDPGSIKAIPQYEWTAPTLLANVGTLPTDVAAVTKWSPNGEFLAVGSLSAPFLDIYQYSLVTGFTKLADPSTLPVGRVGDLTWSPCGDFLVCGNTAPWPATPTPAVTIYQRSGNTFTKLSDPASLPTTSNSAGDCAGGPVHFSPNSDFLLLGFTKLISGAPHPGFILYERNGTTFTDITTTSTLSGIGKIFSWSRDSGLLAGLDLTTGVIDVFDRADNIFTGITPPNVTTYANDIIGFSFSPDGNFLAVTLSVTPWILIFQIVSNTFTLLTNPITISGAGPIAWSPNSEYLGISYGTTPFINVYQIANPTASPTFTLQAALATPPVGPPTGLNWSQTKQFLAASALTTPFIQVYKTASTLPGDSLLWSRGVPNV